MDKELDPLRELDNAGRKEDSPPTVELSSEQKRLASDPGAARKEPEKKEPEKPVERKSGLAPRPGVTAPAPSVPRQHAPPSSPSHTRLRYGGAAVSIRENIAPREHIRLYGNIAPTLTLFTLGIIVAMLGIGVYKGMTAPMTSNPAPGIPTTGGTAPVDSSIYPEANSYVDPLFGPFAIKRCNDRCESHNSPTRETCQRGCNVYQVAIYGRRISLDKYDPASDTAEILNRCTKRDINLETHTSGSAWSDDVTGAVDLLAEAPDAVRSLDLSRYRAYYSKLLQTNRLLRLPPGGTPVEIGLSKELVQANCLAANWTLTAIAVFSAQQNTDEISGRYYRDLLQSLEPKVLDASTRVQAQAKSLKLR